MDSAEVNEHSDPDQNRTHPNEVRSPRALTQPFLWIVVAVLMVFAVTMWGTQPLWFPHVQSAWTGDAAEGDGKSQDQVAGGGASTLDLSPQGRKNIGLTIETVALTDFERTITIPATLVERPGQSRVIVSAPMTGTVTRVYPIRGEAVVPGTPLFDLRMTHEDLVEKQSSFLRSLEELDIIQREIDRLQDVTASGAIAGKRLLEQEYEHQKTDALIRTTQQALLLHGLSEAQVQRIIEERRLLQELTITAPELAGHAAVEQHQEFMQVAELPVNVGEHVQTGMPLATLTDHCRLYLEGKAFEQDADDLNRIANEGTEVTALVEGNGSKTREVSGLRILHIENEVERESRALRFYVFLPNELIRDERTATGQRFIGWRYKPGQRVEVLIPVDQWKRRIVLPLEAVIEEGPEYYVFQEMNGRFLRRPVHVEYRDQRFAVIKNDGTLFPGDKVAAQGAYQIHLAVKNQAGGAVDPHAGHSHH